MRVWFHDIDSYGVQTPILGMGRKAGEFIWKTREVANKFGVLLSCCPSVPSVLAIETRPQTNSRSASGFGTPAKMPLEDHVLGWAGGFLMLEASRTQPKGAVSGTFIGPQVC